MKIDDLIDRNYLSASILEDTRDVCIWLYQHQYLAIIDEQLDTAGIVTLKDLHANPGSRAVIDCDFKKPTVGPDQTVINVLNLMKETGTDFLPVYENNLFVGVIALNNLLEHF